MLIDCKNHFENKFDYIQTKRILPKTRSVSFSNSIFFRNFFNIYIKNFKIHNGVLNWVMGLGASYASNVTSSAFNYFYNISKH